MTFLYNWKLTSLFFAAVFAFALVVVFDGNADVQQQIFKKNDWESYKYKENGTSICYMFSLPKASTGNFKKRSEPNIMVTRRKSTKVTEEVSVTSGYPYKKGVAVKVTIDGKNISFDVVEKEHAWVNDGKDKVVIKSMIKGNKLTVKGVSKKSTFSLDTYSLKGFTANYKSIVKACS